MRILHNSLCCLILHVVFQVVMNFFDVKGIFKIFINRIAIYVVSFINPRIAIFFSPCLISNPPSDSSARSYSRRPRMSRGQVSWSASSPASRCDPIPVVHTAVVSQSGSRRRARRREEAPAQGGSRRPNPSAKKALESGLLGHISQEKRYIALDKLHPQRILVH